jgi:hypothetical protein
LAATKDLAIMPAVMVSLPAVSRAVGSRNRGSSGDRPARPDIEEQTGNKAPHKLWSHADPLAKRVVTHLPAKMGAAPRRLAAELFCFDHSAEADIGAPEPWGQRD